MKSLLFVILIGALFVGCNTTNRTVQNSSEETNMAVGDTVRIANDEIEYEIIIIEPGFNSWLVSTARPEGYYSQQFMESRNYQYVVEWNNRVLQPQRYNPNLYELQINYDPSIDYGYEVNYKLYNYFIYFQLTYDQRLAGFLPRI